MPLASGGIELCVGPNTDGPNAFGPNTAGTAELTLTSLGYSYLARVHAPAPGVTFSRNYLDLRGGQEATIIVRGLPEGFDPAGLRAAAYGGSR